MGQFPILIIFTKRIISRDSNRCKHLLYITLNFSVDCEFRSGFIYWTFKGSKAFFWNFFSILAFFPIFSVPIHSVRFWLPLMISLWISLTVNLNLSFSLTLYYKCLYTHIDPNLYRYRIENSFCSLSLTHTKTTHLIASSYSILANFRWIIYTAHHLYWVRLVRKTHTHNECTYKSNWKQ